jgi:hypothetical protein
MLIWLPTKVSESSFFAYANSFAIDGLPVILCPP